GLTGRSTKSHGLVTRNSAKRRPERKYHPTSRSKRANRAEFRSYGAGRRPPNAWARHRGGPPFFGGWGWGDGRARDGRREKLANHPGGRLGFHPKHGRVTRQITRARRRSSGRPENPKHWRISNVFQLLTG